MGTRSLKQLGVDRAAVINESTRERLKELSGLYAEPLGIANRQVGESLTL